MTQIKTLLIANRGEIALRVARACKDMGIRSVAIYADQDIDADFVVVADEARALNGTTAPETYLDADKVLAIAQEVGADAVHPGYGFLSENAEFAKRVADAGMAWLGPASEVIDLLGDKISARLVAESAGVLPVPGVSSPLQSTEEVLKFAETNGYPLLLKRSDGGGGRGIDVIADKAALDQWNELHELPGAGTSHVFVERYVEVARHVETQCARDSHGGFRVVSTRDCSVQRRHQKLIEEAPAPFLTDEQNATLEKWSQALFEAVGYVGVGTCEFLLEPTGELWFLEVNPRLQVEHPVTEEVSGLDLVAEQVRIAQGDALTPAIEQRGHSIELRITSEDPAQGLMPTSGRLDCVTWPTGPGVRLDLGVNLGQEIVTAFDSMIAKIIVTGADRKQAIARALRALGELRITGVTTPAPVYKDILEDSDFASDDFLVHTRWLETTFLPEHTYEGAGAAPSSIEKETRRSFTIELDGKRMELTVPGDLFQTAAPTATARPIQRRRGVREGQLQTAAAATGGQINSPMQAIVVRLAVEEGQQVAEGDLVMVLEAMKMEKPVYAPVTGTVTTISTTAGASVSAGDPLVTITEEGQE